MGTSMHSGDIFVFINATRSMMKILHLVISCQSLLLTCRVYPCHCLIG
ncbi:MAG: transposase [Bacteroidales bacterium]|nr:transposase [Bacteroidales bacterium]